MNDLESITPAVEILRKNDIPYALLHCTSIYPTPYEKIRLGALAVLAEKFQDAIIGLSDHSNSIYPCLGAVALNASILERHYTSNPNWPGPDIPISMTPEELQRLIQGADEIYRSLGGNKSVLEEEQPTIDFAYASVVAIDDIAAGDLLSIDNIWVKRPGTGEIKANGFNLLLGKKSRCTISRNQQLTWDQVEL